MSTAAATSHVPNLEQRIAAVRKKRSLVKAGTGIAIAAAVLIGVIAGEAVLDDLVEFPWIARALTLVAALGGSGWLLWRETIEPLRRRLHDDAIASMIEHALPAFRTRFIASLQLARAAGRETPHSLVRALLAETAAMAAKQDFRQVVKIVKLKRAGAICAGVIVVTSVLGWAGGASSPVLLKRALLFNIPLPHKTHILSVTEGGRIGVGEDFKVEVTASGLLPGSGQIMVTTAAGLTRQFELPQDPGHRGQYAAVIRSPQESFSYSVRLNDDTSQKYNVETIVRPAVSSVSCEQTYPAYVNLPPVRRSAGDLSLLAGSGLKILVKASTDIAKGWLVLAGLNKESPLAIDPRDGTSLTGEIEIPTKDLTGFSVHLVDTHGVESGETATYRIELLPDRPPTVSITYPTHHEELATPQATVQIAFTAKDDFGVVKAVLHYTLAGGEEKTIDFDLQGQAQKELSRSFDWKLPALNPAPTVGNALEWWVTVADANNITGPGVGTTDHYEFQIVTDAEKRLDIENRLRDTIGGLKDVEQSEEGLNQALGEPLFEKPKEKP